MQQEQIREWTLKQKQEKEEAQAQQKYAGESY